MTVVCASCPTCGAVHLPPEVVHLTVCTPRVLSSYWFDCPICRERVQKPADDHVIALLAGTVAVTYLAVPLEALEQHAGPPLTVDDLLDAMLELASL